MAGLAKPKKCEECNSTELHREWQPERWVCHDGHIVLSRGKKPQTGICTKCGRTKSEEVKFKEGKNLCMDCYNTYMREWNNENSTERKEYKRDYYAKNRTWLRERSNAYWQGSLETFMSDLHHRVKKCAETRFGKRNRVLQFEITKADLLELYSKQDGVCTLTGLKMVHKWHSLYSISVDRIDSSVGYVLGNVQLVTKGANMLKNNHSHAEASEFFDAVRRTFIVPSEVVQESDGERTEIVSEREE